MKTDIWIYFENLLKLNQTIITRYLTWRPIYIFYYISLNSS